MLAAIVCGLGFLAIFWPGGGRAPRLITRLGFAVATFAAGFLAWTKALRGELNPIWEPTRRPGPEAAGS